MSVLLCRVDVLLKADQASGSYWISVGSQYRKGAPAVYGTLKYKSTKSTAIPTTIIQPGPFDTRKWNISNLMSFKPNKMLLATDVQSKKKAAPYLAPAGSQKSYNVPTKVDKRVVLQLTQPLIEANGMLKWVRIRSS